MLEVTGLRVADIDSGRMMIRIEHGKGGKERYVMLSAQLLAILRTYWRLARPEPWLFPGRDATRPIEPTTLHAACRTAALGGHVRRCADCGHTAIAYNSCRNRHCPKCQGRAREAWVAARRAELLPGPYFHVVFTLPAPVGAIAFQNKGDGLRHPVPRRRRDGSRLIAADPRHLGTEIGGVAVLHSWGQAMQHHPLRREDSARPCCARSRTPSTAVWPPSQARAAAPSRPPLPPRASLLPARVSLVQEPLDLQSASVPLLCAEEVSSSSRQGSVFQVG